MWPEKGEQTELVVDTAFKVLPLYMDRQASNAVTDAAIVGRRMCRQEYLSWAIFEDRMRGPTG